MNRTKPALLGALALLGGWLLIAGNLVWVVVTFGESGLQVEVSGGTIAPLVAAVGSVCLGAAAALLLVRSWGRPVVAALAALASVGLSIQLFGNLAGDWASADWVGELALQHSGVSVPSGVLVTAVDWTIIPTLVLVASLCAAAVGALVVVVSPRWPRSGRRYERSSGQDQSPHGQWDTLSHGGDPTAQRDDLDLHG